uniref:Histone deacetylase domain-containing protein n=1 Tax=Physcomitrium patens TaxID=3218 RepID=A0A7I4AKU4_PHYPA
MTDNSPDMNQVHVFFHEDMLKHNNGYGVFDTFEDPGFLDVLEPHPENADRIRNIRSILQRGPIAPFITWHEGRPCEIESLERFHTPEYIKELIDADSAGGEIICAGTRLHPGSWAAALLAAGSAQQAMQYLLDGHGQLAYALVRPPGHHAQPTQADGYCFLNNAGIAVELAVHQGCKRVVVLDIDVHYGNGTAEGFYSRKDVYTISLHMNHGSWGPSHPQTGLTDECGEGLGKGFNLNIPLPNGTGNKGYEHAMTELVVPAMAEFKPEMIVLTVGQDSSEFCPWCSLIRMGGCA